MPERTIGHAHATCPSCFKAQTLFLPIEGIEKYKAGAKVQDAFPNSSSTVRETLLSGYCAKCQDDIFCEED